MSQPSSPSPGALPWSKLLVTTDFSDDSLHAWQQASALAAAHSVEIVIVHVTEPPFQGLRIHTETLHEEMEQGANKRIQALAESLFGAHAKTQIHVVQGRPASVICDLAAQTGSQLIVISSHGHSGLKHVLLGSVVEDVVRHAPCAVLVVPVGKR